MIPDGANHRTVVAWTGAVEDLVNGGYIRDLGQGKFFELTRKGYAAVDEEPGP